MIEPQTSSKPSRLFVAGLVLLAVVCGIGLQAFASKALMTLPNQAAKPSDQVAAPLQKHPDQRTFVYVLEDGSSVAAESALGKLTAQGWRIVSATAFAPWTSHQTLDGAAVRGVAPTATISNDLAALLILEKISP